MLIPQHNETPTTKAVAEHMSPTKGRRLQPAVHRSTVIRGKLSESRLTAATLTPTPETCRKYKVINTQSEKMPAIYISLKETERLHSYSKYGTMFNYVTDIASSPYIQSPPRSAHQHKSTTNVLSLIRMLKYQRTRHIQGMLKPKKGESTYRYLARTYMYLKVHKPRHRQVTHAFTTRIISS